jgi:hypothetical protein
MMFQLTRSRWTNARVFNIEQSSVSYHSGSDHAWSSVLMEETAGAEQVRAAIGRLLRQYYEVSLPPVSGNLAEVIKKLEESACQSDLALTQTDTR